MRFREWYYRSLVLELLNEAKIGFGKFAGQDVNRVPSKYWQWLADQMNQNQYDVAMRGKPKNITDDQGKQLSWQQVWDVINTRASGQDWQIDTPTVAPQVQQSQQRQQGQLQRRYVLSQSKGSGNYVVASKNPNGTWQVMDRQGKTWDFPEDKLPDMITSVKDGEGRVIDGYNPKDLFDISSSEKGIRLGFDPEKASGLGYEDFEEKDQEEENPREHQYDPNANPNMIPPNMMTDHQRDIDEAFAVDDRPLTMNALAGSGKTTMLRHLAAQKQPSEKWLYLVFNKKNQVEATTPKMSKVTGKKELLFPRENMDVLTSHSFLGGVLRNSAKTGAFADTVLHDKNNGKIGELMDHPDVKDEIEDRFPKRFLWEAKGRIRKIVGMCKAYVVDPKAGDSAQQVQDIMQRTGIDGDLSTEQYTTDRDWTPELVESALDILHYSQPSEGPTSDLAQVRDHDDTLWYAALYADNIAWPKYDVVLADEVQDFNRCQIVMLQKLAERGARIVAVGDPNQSIYSFRGADNQAFNKIQEMFGDDGGGSTHPLPMNFRSGRKIIDYVNQNTIMSTLDDDKQLVAGLDKEGDVTEGMGYEDALDNISKEWIQNNGKFKNQTSIISPQNAPLVETALDLLKNNIDFVILGRDLSKELIQHIQRVTGKGRYATNYSIDQFSEVMRDHFDDLKQKWGNKMAKRDQLAEMEKTVEALSSVISYLAGDGSGEYRDPNLNMNVGDSKDLIQYIKRRFGGVNENDPQAMEKLANRDQRSFVTLTTGHKSKGMEYERVFIKCPELFYSNTPKTEDEAIQQDNLKYVAFTRAMDELHVMAPCERR